MWLEHALEKLFDKAMGNAIIFNGTGWKGTVSFELLDSIVTGDYETDNEVLKNGTWDSLWGNAKRYGVFLFGTGRACKVFIERYRSELNISGLIDSNPFKEGKTFEGYTIFSPNILEEKKDTSMVVITSTVYMNEIAYKLDSMNFHRYWGFAALEAQNAILRLTADLLNFVFWKLLPVKKDRILVRGGKYCSNGKAIVDQLLEDGFDGEILWANPDYSSQYPSQVKLLKSGPIAHIIAHATSKLWIDDIGKPLWIKKKENQFYINVWHGSMPLKKVNLDDSSIIGKYKKMITHDSSMVDLRISNGKYCTDMYRRAMRYHGEVLEAGTPRLDCLFRGAEAVREKLNLPEYAKLALYAPTFRDASQSGHFTVPNSIELDFIKVKDALEKRFGGDFYILLRLHPAAKRIPLPVSSHVINATDWDDVYELLLGCDILLSDYSSLIFEMGFIYKPVFLYANDYEEYKRERGLYLEFDEMPFPYAFNQKDLETAICGFEEGEYKEKLSQFNAEVLGVKEDGTATRQVCDVIYKVLKGDY